LPNRNSPRGLIAIWLPGRRRFSAIAGALLMTIVAGCTTPTLAPTGPPAPTPVSAPATLTTDPTPDAGGCAPDRLVRCVPGLADIEPGLFDMVRVGPADESFGFIASSAASGAVPQYCSHLPDLGAKGAQTLDVAYRPVTDPDRRHSDDRFPNGVYFNVRFMAAGTGEGIAATMTNWAHRCPMWSFTPALNDDRLLGWMIAESADRFKQYESGNLDGNWQGVTHTAVAVLANGVVVQAAYETPDPSASSRHHILAAILQSAGHHRARSALPAELARWSPGEISTLLPPLASDVTIDLHGSPIDSGWLLCPQADHGQVPLYDSVASWKGPPPSSGPYVTIDRSRPGVHYLDQIRREITTCTTHLADNPPLCAYQPFHQSLTSDSAVAEGENVLRIVQRWIRVEKVQGYDRCVEGTQALRIAQVRGLIVTSRVDYSVVKGVIGDPPLMLEDLDRLIADTVRAVKAA